MKITLLLTGKTTQIEIKNLMSVYIKRIEKSIAFEIVELPDIKFTFSTPPDVIQKKEFEQQKKILQSQDYILLLDEKGKEFTSVAFSNFIAHKQIENRKNIVFIIGGAYGFAAELRTRANEIISLSKLTFPHQLVRLIFVEQLYRAFSILENKEYHH